MKDLHYIEVTKHMPQNDMLSLRLSYQVFGQKLGTAPVVLVNHALTGNSDVAGKKRGWWNALIGAHKVIDTHYYTIIAFNIPGNGYDGTLITSYKRFTAKDIAIFFLEALSIMRVAQLHAVIGGSLGGGIAWEMAALAPEYILHIIPIAADWKATDWIIGHNYIQEKILLNSKEPLEDARMMAMLFYRTPMSLNDKFQRTKISDKNQYNVAQWLQYHGAKLESRFTLEAYLMMNHLLTTIDIAARKPFEEVVAPIQGTIIQIAVDSDLFFIKEENIKTHHILNALGNINVYYEIKSKHGHDAFLIAHQQLAEILKPFFRKKGL